MTGEGGDYLPQRQEWYLSLCLGIYSLIDYFISLDCVKAILFTVKILLVSGFDETVIMMISSCIFVCMSHCANGEKKNEAQQGRKGLDYYYSVHFNVWRHFWVTNFKLGWQKRGFVKPIKGAFPIIGVFGTQRQHSQPSLGKGKAWQWKGTTIQPDSIVIDT